MLIRLTVLNPSTNNLWDEDYNKPDIKSEEAAQQWAKDLINWFNETSTPGGSSRQLLAVNTFPEGTPGDWRVTRR